MQRATGTLTTHGLVGSVRRLGRVLAFGALAAGCTASGGDESILVLKNVAPPAGATGGVCTFSASESEPVLVHGVLDTSAGTGYEFTAQLKSRITADTGQDDQRTIFVRGANVDLAFSDSSAVTAAELADLQSKNLLHFMAPFSAPLPPNGGIADTSFELIPAEIAALLDAKAGFTTTALEATFTVVGELAGDNVSSQVFHYSVTLGHAILLANRGPCASLPSTFTARTGNACFPGQDFAIDCCTAGATPVCPAVATGM
jgi:hypothetical protein